MIKLRPDCVCGARYEDFSTGLTYAKVHAMLLAGPDSAFWRDKSPAAVRRHWSQIKRMQWDQLHGYCEAREAEAFDPAHWGPPTLDDVARTLADIAEELEHLRIEIAALRAA